MGCSGGDTEGELEKKAKRGFKFFDTAGWIIVASALAGVSLYVGYSTGVACGENIGYGKGKKAGVVEGQRAAEEPTFIEVTPHYITANLARGDGELGSTTYTVSMSNGKIEETVCVLRCNGQGICYTDSGSYMIPGAIYDGKVDLLGIRTNGDWRELNRSRDYAENHELFDDADVVFNNAKTRFAMPQ